MQVRGVVEESRTEPLVTFDVDDDVTTLKYLDSRMYVALQNGQLVVVARDAGQTARRVCLLCILDYFFACLLADGVWLFDQPQTIEVGSEPITSLLDVGFDMWAACGKHVHVVSLTPTFDEEQGAHLHRDDVTKVFFLRCPL